MADILLEVCVDDVEGLRAAVEGGADRIELCSALSVGGLTPSAGLLNAASKVKVPCYAMIRPRPGNFVYSAHELQAMCDDIQFAASAGMAGVVIGASRPDGSLDAKALQTLSNAVGRMPRTLHRAFDLVPAIEPAIELAVDCGFERILTSGRARSVPEGLDELERIIKLADGRLSIMPGAGVKLSNLDAIVKRLKIREIHSSCSVPVAIADEKLLSFGFSGTTLPRTDAPTVRAFKGKLAEL